MRLRNDINKIGRNINQIVKNSNSHIYNEDDKIKLSVQLTIIRDLIEKLN